MLHTHKSENDIQGSPKDGHSILEKSSPLKDAYMAKDTSSEKNGKNRYRPENLNFGGVGFTFNNEMF